MRGVRRHFEFCDALYYKRYSERTARYRYRSLSFHSYDYVHASRTVAKKVLCFGTTLTLDRKPTQPEKLRLTEVHGQSASDTGTSRGCAQTLLSAIASGDLPH